MTVNKVGKIWDDKIKSGESDYASVQVPEVMRFRTTVEISRLRALLSSINGQKVLQAGCGSGKYSLSLASYGLKATALDYSYRLLKNVSELSRLLQIKPGDLKLLCADIERLPMRSGVYDMVFNDGVVEHWLEDEARVAVIREMARVVRPGGLVVIYVPNGAHPFHKKWMDKGYTGYLSAPPMTLYSADKLKKEMEMAGLKSVAVDGLQSFYSFNQWPYRSWLRLPIAALNRYMKLPAKIRKTWGIHLLGIGRK